ncbi:MAG: hypothetical protein Tsb0020_45560 [Haliangiales bacterium]
MADFVLPLVAGGELRIGRPISLAEAEHLGQDLPHASAPLVEIDEARAAVLSELIVRPPALVLDADEVYLAAALYNVLFLVHPEVDGVTLGRRGLSRVAETARRLAAQPLTRSRRAILARHALLHNVFDVARADIRVSWWTGSAEFRGQAPPTRLVAWRDLRRVREETEWATYADLMNSDEATPVMAILMRRSPLTQLLSAHPQAPALHWEDAVFLLRDPELARAICYRALAPTDAHDKLAAPARYAAAFEQLLERNPNPSDIRTVAAFLVHLAALLALGETGQRDMSAASATLTTVLSPERASKRPRGLATFLALPNALRAVDVQLSAPPGLTDDPRLLQRWQLHRAQIADGVGDAVIETLTARIQRRLGGGLALPPTRQRPALPPADRDRTSPAEDAAQGAVEVGEDERHHDDTAERASGDVVEDHP